MTYTPPLPSLTCDTPHVQNHRTSPQCTTVKKLHANGGIFARDFARQVILREAHFARDFAREDSDPSPTYVLTFDLVAIFLNLLIQFDNSIKSSSNLSIDLSQFQKKSLSKFFSLKFGLHTYIAWTKIFLWHVL